MSNNDTVNFAMRLRALGETVDGRRFENLYLVRDEKNAKNDGSALYIFNDVELAEAKDRPNTDFRVLQEIRPDTGNDGQPPHVSLAGFTDAQIRINEVVVATITSPTDSIFFTDSAIEKFVFPYYEQLRIFPNSYMEMLKRHLYEPETRKRIVCLVHQNPSDSTIIYKAGGPSSPPSNIRYLVDVTGITPSAKEMVFGEDPGVDYALLTPDQLEFIVQENR